MRFLPTFSAQGLSAKFDQTSKLVLAYALVVFVVGIVQVALQGRSFNINKSGFTILLKVHHAPDTGVKLLANTTAAPVLAPQENEELDEGEGESDDEGGPGDKSGSEDESGSDSDSDTIGGANSEALAQPKLSATSAASTTFISPTDSKSTLPPPSSRAPNIKSNNEEFDGESDSPIGSAIDGETAAVSSTASYDISTLPQASATMDTLVQPTASVILDDIESDGESNLEFDLEIDSDSEDDLTAQQKLSTFATPFLTKTVTASNAIPPSVTATPASQAVSDASDSDKSGLKDSGAQTGSGSEDDRPEGLKLGRKKRLEFRRRLFPSSATDRVSTIDQKSRLKFRRQRRSGTSGVVKTTEKRAATHLDEDGGNDADSEEDVHVPATTRSYRKQQQAQTMKRLVRKLPTSYHPREHSLLAKVARALPRDSFQPVKRQDVPTDPDKTFFRISLNGHSETVSLTCADSLERPLTSLEHQDRQAIAFIAFEIWLLFLSAYSLWASSVPHILAVMVARVLAFIFSIVEATQTRSFHTRIHNQVIAGTCNGADFIAGYWQQVLNLQVAIAVVEGVAMLVFALLSVRLFKAFKFSTFKKVGADRWAGQLRNMQLIFQMLLQLSLYFLITMHAMFLNELLHYRDSHQQSGILSKGYQAFLIILTVSVIPWAVAGWAGMHRECFKCTAAFLLGAIVFIANGIFVLFVDANTVLRNAEKNWVFLQFIGSIAAALVFASMFIAVISLKFFGKGYLAPLKLSQEADTNHPNGHSKEFIIDFPAPMADYDKPKLYIDFVDMPQANHVHKLSDAIQNSLGRQNSYRTPHYLLKKPPTLLVSIPRGTTKGQAVQTGQTENSMTEVSDLPALWSSTTMSTQKPPHISKTSLWTATTVSPMNPPAVVHNKASRWSVTTASTQKNGFPTTALATDAGPRLPKPAKSIDRHTMWSLDTVSQADAPMSFTVRRLGGILECSGRVWPTQQRVDEFEWDSTV